MKGDSRVAGTVPVGITPTTNLAGQLAIQLAAATGRTILATNTGVNGSYPFTGQPLLVTSYLPDTIVFGETDVNGYSGQAPGLGGVPQTGAQVCAGNVALATSARELGIKRVVLCSCYVNPADTQIAAGNVALRAASTTSRVTLLGPDPSAFFLADLALTIDATNHAYFPDGTHPNAAGVLLMVAVILPVMLAAL